jgi:carbon storage regulator CsrA
LPITCNFSIKSLLFNRLRTTKNRRGALLVHSQTRILFIEIPAGEQLTVTVLEVKGNHVRIGTDAPEAVSIMREELLEKVES